MPDYNLPDDKLTDKNPLGVRFPNEFGDKELLETKRNKDSGGPNHGPSGSGIFSPSGPITKAFAYLYIAGFVCSAIVGIAFWFTHLPLVEKIEYTAILAAVCAVLAAMRRYETFARLICGLFLLVVAWGIDLPVSLYFIPRDLPLVAHHPFLIFASINVLIAMILLPIKHSNPQLLEILKAPIILFCIMDALAIPVGFFMIVARGNLNTQQAQSLAPSDIESRFSACIDKVAGQSLSVQVNCYATANDEFNKRLQNDQKIVVRSLGNRRKDINDFNQFMNGMHRSLDDLVAKTVSKAKPGTENLVAQKARYDFLRNGVPNLEKTLNEGTLPVPK